MASPGADRPADGAEQCASRYTIYSKYLSLLERNQHVARASDVRVEAIEEFDEADRADYKLFRRLVYDQLAIYREQHNDAAIDELHSTVVGKFRRVFGHGHWNTVNATLEYGQLLRGEKRYGQAEALYRTLVDEMDRDSVPESVAVLCIFNALGTVYAKRQKLEEAEAILVRAVAGFRTQSGDRDVRTLTAAFNLGGVYQDRGKLSRAISMYHGAAYGFKDVMGISDKRTIAAFTQLAAVCFARHALPRAEEAYKLALRGLEEGARQSSMDALILKLDLGILYRDVGRLEAAEMLTREVCQGLKDASSGHAATALTCLGTVYARQGRAAEAETSFSDAVKEFAACEAEYSTMAYAASFSLGNLLRSHRRLAEAETMYQQAWNGARSVGGPQHATSCTVADALSSLYEEQGKYEEAEEVYKQSLAPGEFRPDRWTSFVLSVNFHKMAGYI